MAPTPAESVGDRWVFDVHMGPVRTSPEVFLGRPNACTKEGTQHIARLLSKSMKLIIFAKLRLL